MNYQDVTPTEIINRGIVFKNNNNRGIIQEPCWGSDSEISNWTNLLRQGAKHVHYTLSVWYVTVNLPTSNNWWTTDELSSFDILQNSEEEHGYNIIYIISNLQSVGSQSDQ